MEKISVSLFAFSMFFVFASCHHNDNLYSEYDHGTNNWDRVKTKGEDERYYNWHDYDEHHEEDSYSSSSEEEYDNNGKGYKDKGSVVCTFGERFIRHASNCGKFYQCANGKAHLTDCPAGLHFNTETEICDWPSNVDCDNDYDSSQSESYESYDEDDGDDDDDDDNDDDDSNEATTKGGYKPSDRNKGYYPDDPERYYVTDTGKVYYKNNQQKFVSVQTKGTQPSSNPQVPQFVTHYHYSYKPSQPQPPQKHKLWTKDSGHQNQMNQPMVSAFSNLLMAMSSMRPSWHNSKPQTMMPQRYQTIETYPKTSYNKGPQIQKKIIVHHTDQQPTYQKKIIIHHDDNPVVQKPIVKIVKENPVPKHKIIIHTEDKNQHHGVKGDDDHIYYYDSTKGDNYDDMYYHDYSGEDKKGDVLIIQKGDNNNKGGNVLQNYIDTSMYNKEKFKGGALFSPQYFGKAFKGLTSNQNLVHFHHHYIKDKGPTKKVIKYVHYNHPAKGDKGDVVFYPVKGDDSYYVKGYGGGQKGGLNGLLKTLLLMSPGGLRTIMMSKLLGSLNKGGTSYNKGGDKGFNMMEFLLLQRILGNSNQRPSPTANPPVRFAPTIILETNRILRADNRQPVTLFDPSTGAVVTPANAAVLPNGQVVNVANGLPIGYIDSVTRRYVPATLVYPGTRTAAPVRVVGGGGGAAARSLVTPLDGSASRQGINLVFLSPFTPMSLPQPSTNSRPSSTYIQETLRQLLGNDLTRYLTPEALSSRQGTGITRAAGRGGGTCTVVRGEDFVPFFLPLQDGRRLGSSDCNAMGQLLDTFVANFLQNFVPSDVMTAGLSTNSINTKATQQDSNRHVFDVFDQTGQQLPPLVPSSNNANANNNFVGPTSNSRGNNYSPGSTYLTGNKSTMSAQWNSIKDYITVRNDASGCVITVPHIMPRC